MNSVIVATVSGLALGGTFALIGLGLVVAFRATQTLNFAHGAMMLVPTILVARWQSEGTAPLAVAVVVALALSVAIGLLLYWTVLQRTTGLPEFMPFIATLGFASALQAIVLMWIGVNGYSVKFPGITQGTMILLGARISKASLILAAVSFALAAVIAAVMRYTHLGTRVRAAGQDPILASQGGIQVRRIYTGAWALVGVLACIAGVSYATTNLVTVSMSDIALAAFPAILLGGLDSIEGAIVGGCLIGLLQSFTAMYLGGEYLDAVTYSVLLVVLLLYPGGLFGTTEVRKL